MSKAKRIKEKQRRDKQREEIEKQRELEELDSELEGEELLEDEIIDEDAEEEEIKKSYFGGEYNDVASIGGPLTFEQLDEARAAEEKAHEIREMSYDVQMLVRNIINAPMLEPQEKATYIKSVGNEFGGRVSAIMEKPAEMMKEAEDLDLLSIEAILAHDTRNMGMIDKFTQFLQKRDLSYASRQSLSDSDFALVYEVDGKKVRKYPIHDKAHVRNALARAAQQIKAGGQGAADARKALPKIRAAAKKFGIETSMQKGKSAIIIQKDAQGDWRWVGWPSNNFIDHSKDILTEGAHQRYVEWWHKNKKDLGFPVFTSMHAPFTVRKNPVDFVGYENGFLVMSGKLTDGEAEKLLKAQKKFDIGMSITGHGLRDKNDPRQITDYIIYEVTDLPVAMADNPFTDLAVMKEVEMLKKEEQLAYLTEIMGSEDLAKEALEAKTARKQAELQEMGIEQKSKNDEEPPAEEAPAPEFAELIEKIGKEFDIEGLNEFVKTAQDALDKVPLLEQIIQKQQAEIKKLGAETDEQLAEMIAPKIAPKFSWSKARASQSDENVLEGEELKKAKSKVPGIPEGEEWWLSQETGIAPVMADDNSA